VCLGNDLGDEEIDIGGNGPPVSSYQPVEIEKEKDTGHKSSKISSDSSSGKKKFALLCFFLFVLQNFCFISKILSKNPHKGERICTIDVYLEENMLMSTRLEF
jgi:hypothetical protein